MIPKVETFAGSEFEGLYGYPEVYTRAGFLGTRFFVFETERRGQQRVYLFDTTSRQMKQFKVNEDSDKGHYQLVLRSGQSLGILYMEPGVPSKIYLVKIKSLLHDSVEEFAAAENL